MDNSFNTVFFFFCCVYPVFFFFVCLMSFDLYIYIYIYFFFFFLIGNIVTENNYILGTVKIFHLYPVGG